MNPLQVPIIITIQTHTLHYAYECSMNIQFNPDSQTVSPLHQTDDSWANFHFEYAEFIVRRALIIIWFSLRNFSLFSFSCLCGAYIINNFPLVKYSKSLSSSALFPSLTRRVEWCHWDSMRDTIIIIDEGVCKCSATSFIPWIST